MANKNNKGMKFIDLLKARDRRSGKRHKLCPCPRGCFPVEYTWDENMCGMGFCVGLRYTVEDLDCISMCTFPTSKGKRKRVCFLMTPNEAIDIARCLLETVSWSLEYASSYEVHRQHLSEAMKEKGYKFPLYSENK